MQKNEAKILRSTSFSVEIWKSDNGEHKGKVQYCYRNIEKYENESVSKII